MVSNYLPDGKAPWARRAGIGPTDQVAGAALHM